jgi:hypothetical protein
MALKETTTDNFDVAGGVVGGVLCSGPQAVKVPANKHIAHRLFSIFIMSSSSYR